MATDISKHFIFALCAALSVGFISIIFVLRWVFYYKEGLAWDGGLGEFNWHPILNVVGFIFMQGIAIIVYRLPWTWTCSKLMMKFIHAGLNTLAFILAAIALVAVFDFHNTAKIPNMYSLHSWVGLAAVILYALQLVLGVCAYLIPITPMSWRAAYMPVHTYSGLFIFTSVIAAALMGFTEKLIFGLKDPKYKDSPPEAVFVNVLGLLVMMFGAIVLWIATRPEWKRPAEQAPPALQTSAGESAEGRTGTVMSPHTGWSDPAGNGDTRRRNGKFEGQDNAAQIN